MKPENPFQTFRILHSILGDFKIPHALIGGWAVVAWGVVRTTRDVDLLADIPNPVRTELRKGLRGAGFEVEWRKGGHDDPIPELLRLLQPGGRNEPGIPVDIIIASREFEVEALRRAVPIDLSGWKAPVLVVEDIIAMKLSAGSPLDIQDARMLLEIHHGRLDEALLRDCCSRLKVMRLLKQARP